MKKEVVSTVLLGIFLLLIMFISGCEWIDISQLSDEELQNIAKEVIVCDSPYIRHEVGCCLDQNTNSICDKDEAVQKPDVKGKETPSGVSPPIEQPSAEPTKPTCEDIDEQPSKDNCFLQLGLEKNDEKICNKINLANTKNKCYFDIAMVKQKPEICPEGQRNSCYAELGIRNYDLTMCQKIVGDEDLKGNCLYEIAVFNEDPFICEKIISEKWLNMCRQELGWVNFRELNENPEKYIGKEVIINGFIDVSTSTGTEKFKRLYTAIGKEGYRVLFATKIEREFFAGVAMGEFTSKNEFTIKGIFEKDIKKFCSEKCDIYYIRET